MLVACLGSSDERKTQAPRELRLEPDVVSGIQSQLGVPPARAIDLASEDALLANELERTLPEAARYVRSLALARVLLSAVGHDARERSPVTDPEIAARVAERWWELDRPRMVRVVHAVVLADTENAAAREVAERIRRAVETARDLEAFEQAARGVDAAGLTVQVERLPPVAADGRSVDPRRPPPLGPPVRSMAREFAEAAARLTQAGELSPVVKSPFGYHVIRLLEVIEPQTVSPAEHRAKLEPELLAERAGDQRDALLQELRGEVGVEQERSALSAMESVGTQP